MPKTRFLRRRGKAGFGKDPVFMDLGAGFAGSCFSVEKALRLTLIVSPPITTP